MSRLPCLSSGDLPDPGIQPKSSALWADSLPFELNGDVFFLLRGVVKKMQTPDTHHHPGCIRGFLTRPAWAAEALTSGQHLLRVCEAEIFHFQEKIYKCPIGGETQKQGMFCNLYTLCSGESLVCLLLCQSSVEERRKPTSSACQEKGKL